MKFPPGAVERAVTRVMQTHPLKECPVSEDGKHAWVDMEGLYSDYCAHCGTSKPLPTGDKP